MSWMDEQTTIDITGTTFPKFTDSKGDNPERFWFIKEQFIQHSQKLLNEGQIFSSISARLINERWICDNHAITKSDIASFVWEMRLFYMKSEYMSIHSFCSYMESNIENDYVINFFRHMRESWKKHLSSDDVLFRNEHQGPVKTNKQLIDTLLYSDNFHTQEKYKKRYDELLVYMDESLILKRIYNAMHCGYQMNQISRSVMDLNEDSLVIKLPNHLQHEWSDNCPYEVIR